MNDRLLCDCNCKYNCVCFVIITVDVVHNYVFEENELFSPM